MNICLMTYIKYDLIIGKIQLPVKGYGKLHYTQIAAQMTSGPAYLFYEKFPYLFTELFLMVDSRAKNAFPSFMGSETE